MKPRTRLRNGSKGVEKNKTLTRHPCNPFSIRVIRHHPCHSCLKIHIKKYHIRGRGGVVTDFDEEAGGGGERSLKRHTLPARGSC